ncbi:ABC transporter ATP-binding protein [Vagococcus lutrae]|uniref:ABC transporter ATP-binding protein n=1 Tax=Vagococcus lutrae TaxID=81947 RepID=A0AAE9XEB3_9ENTE|nr:ABC transporter ATP-binding protein [Vagococcus lutrae]WCG22592.1 ABC transporter ATP-binding protein [Vagococcus lutrae]
MLELKDISFVYEERPILSNLSLTIEPGEFISVIGKSGCGKSTLIKLIAGLLEPNSGTILYQKTPVTLGAVSYMPQKPLLLPWKTVKQNICLSDRIKGQKTITEEELKIWLNRAGLAEYENAYPHELSGGMQQRVAFLRTLMSNQDVLLLDEPFGALDSMTKQVMQEWLLTITTELNKTVVFVTHDLEEALFLSDRIIMLDHEEKQSEEIYVPFARPRMGELRYTAEFLAERHQLEGRLKRYAEF